VNNSIRSFFIAAVAVFIAATMQISSPSAQQAAPSAQPADHAGPPQPEHVVTTYRPAAKRVSPQDGFAALQHSSAPTPRDADGHPDLTGNWGANFGPSPFGGGGIRKTGTREPDQAVMQRGAQWNKPLYKPEYWEKVRSLDFSKADVDPGYGCGQPSGVPRQNVPARIIQKGQQIVLMNGVENMIRILPLDGRKRDPQDFEYSTFNGMGLASWDGDTLVVESVGFNDISWLGWEGYFHSDKMTVTERFRREGDLLFYNFTVDDPDVLMEPWHSIMYIRKVNPNPTRQDEASQCEERDFKLLADPYNRG
jgi:hypothetical protein